MNMSEPLLSLIRLLIVDDHTLVREGIAAALVAQGDIDIVAQASNGAEAVAQYSRYRPDVALLDLQMPVQGGIDAIREIRARHSDARIIVLSTFAGGARIAGAMQAGASAYLLKEVRGVELANAIRNVHHGLHVLASEAKLAIHAYHPADVLSRREVEVLTLAASGNSNRTIGEHLHISETTVKTHMSTILVKLGANDRTHACTIAVKLGYFSV
jgi:DNA-binding NarL/FixJ family response regulator